MFLRGKSHLLPKFILKLQSHSNNRLSLLNQRINAASKSSSSSPQKTKPQSSLPTVKRGKFRSSLKRVRKVHAPFRSTLSASSSLGVSPSRRQCIRFIVLVSDILTTWLSSSKTKSDDDARQYCEHSECITMSLQARAT